MTTREDVLQDALDHIMRVARGSRTQTRRIRWIFERARCALFNEDWREVDLKHPRMVLRGLPSDLEQRLETLHEPGRFASVTELADFVVDVKDWHDRQKAQRFAPDRPEN